MMGVLSMVMMWFGVEKVSSSPKKPKGLIRHVLYYVTCFSLQLTHPKQGQELTFGTSIFFQYKPGNTVIVHWSSIMGGPKIMSFVDGHVST